MSHKERWIKFFDNENKKLYAKCVSHNQGYVTDQDLVKHYCKIGESYLVSKLEVHDFKTEVELFDFRVGMPFNSVNFKLELK